MKSKSWVAFTSSISVSVLLLSSCGLFSGNNNTGKTLADLPDATLPDSKNTVAVVDREKIGESYRKALASADDPILRQQIMTHIADFEMANSEQQQLQSADTERHFDQPIAMYRELIEQQEKSGQPIKGVEVDQLRYKLAKALAMDGRNDESSAALDQLAQTAPSSKLIGETQFRRAEKAFADGDYIAAQKHYKSVADDNSNPLQQNAQYMQGWAEFKRSDYEMALQSFIKVLDHFMKSAQKPDQVEATVASLTGAQKNMMNDTLHVMSLSFSYLDGGQSIVDLQKNMGDRVYEHLLYEELGQLYLEQKRFSDSAETYKQFVTQNPQSDFAPQFSMKMITVYEQGDFPSLILPAKREYIEHYGISSNFWKQRNGAIGKEALAYLYTSLQELAEYDHAQAQELNKTNKAEAKLAYGRAATWYREFVASFPQDPKASEMTFLLAESLSEVGDYPQAIDAYEQVAYQYKDKVRGPDSAYSIVLLSQDLATNQAFSETQKASWQERNRSDELD
jgi:TolA-binding protein